MSESRAPNVLGLVALTPIACWLALPAVVYLLGGVPDRIADHFEGVVAILYVAFWLGVAATAVAVPSTVGAVGLALALAKRRWLAATLNAAALALGTTITAFIWLDFG